METQLRKIGISANPQKKSAAKFIRILINEFAKLNSKQGKFVQVLLDEKFQQYPTKSTNNSSTLVKNLEFQSISSEADVILLLGGDGSILECARELFGNSSFKKTSPKKFCPIMGVNLGRLGFLTGGESQSSHEIKAIVKHVANGNYKISMRDMIEINYLPPPTQTEKKDEKIWPKVPLSWPSGYNKSKTLHALNEIVVSHGNIARMAEINLCINDELVNNYHGDGVIISTPTGSTAYNLSAGGPIVEPHSQNIIITPICPHAIANRSLVIGNKNSVQVRSQKNTDDNRFFEALAVTIDGKLTAYLPQGAGVEIRKSQYALPLAFLPNHSFYHIIHEKLHWQGAVI